MAYEAVITKNLTKRFRKIEAVKELDLIAPEGSIVGFLGRNGSGKTTTIKMLLGLLRPTHGSIAVLGRDPTQDGIGVRQRVGYVPEQTKMHGWMTVAHILGFVSGFFRDWDWGRVDQLLEQFELPVEKKWKHLSLGMRVRLSLILALAFNPKLLILDEPFAGLDVIARRNFLRGLREIIEQEHHTVLISSHLIHELEKVINWVAIIDKGALLLSRPIEDLKVSMKKVKLFCNERTDNALRNIDGIIKVQGEGPEKVATIAKSSTSILERLREASAEVMEEIPLSLEDIFLECVEMDQKTLKGI